MSDTYLITGGAGFIGSNMARTLIERGHRVRIIDDLSTGRRSNIADIDGDIDFVEGTICDPAALDAVTTGARYVIHLAAQVSVPRSMEDPLGTHETNGTGTVQVLEAARRHDCERVVLAASCAVYGNDPSLPKRESMGIDLVSPYAVSKYMGEVYATCYTRNLGQDAIALRYFNVFGPRQDPSGGYAAVIPAFITQMLRGERPTIFGDGKQTRDFVYVQNIVEATLKACQSRSGAGEVFNVGTGRQTSLLELVATLNGLLGTDLEPIHQPERAGDVRRSVADISRAHVQLGYECGIGLKAGLERTTAWYQES